MAARPPVATPPDPKQRPRLRFMTCGSVDDGKSTLIGRLLYDCGAVYEDHLAEAESASGTTLDFSYLVDGLRAEREQGITIDVAYRYFKTPRRAFLIADAPGHEQYTGNQAAAASQTDLAVALASAADGVQPQTRRHMAIAALFGVRDVVLAINKMDRVDFGKRRFDLLAAALREIAAGLDLNVVAAVPLCARDGDNVVTRSAAMDWYAGPTLIEVLESFEPAAPTVRSAILPLALTGRIAGGGRVSYGEIAAGSVAIGQTLHTETGLDVTVTRLWSAGEPATRAHAGEAVAVELAPERDLGRGSVLAAEPLAPAVQVRGRFVWLSAEPPHSGRTYELQIGTGQTSATMARIDGRLDLDTLAMGASDDDITSNDIVVARFNLSRSLPALPFAQSRRLGAFILTERVSRRTVAAGVLLAIERLGRDTPWHALQIAPADRARQLGQRPFVVWLTGLSGAGKSTIADLLDRRLHSLGRHAVVLDGDNLRHGLNADLGFSDADRSENIRRVGYVAALMADAGLIVIVSLISPFRQDRARARDVVGRERFMEVFVDAPLAVCQQRDPKGMYARARAGTLPRFTGVAAGYDPPEAPDVHLRTDQSTPEAAMEQVLSLIRERGLL